MSLNLKAPSILQIGTLTYPTHSNLKLQPRILPAVTRSSHKRTLVLDLDETLVHSSFVASLSPPDNIIFETSGSQQRTLYVSYRPGLLQFLEKVSKNYELVVYTASTKEYAEQVINKIDPNRRILKYRLYREDCIEVSGHYIKDLSRLGRDLSQVIIIDNSVTAFIYHLNNGIPIMSWFDNPEDNELEKASCLLDSLLSVCDFRPVLNSIFNLSGMLEQYKNICE